MPEIHHHPRSDLCPHVIGDPVHGDRQDRRNPDDEYTGVAPDDRGPTVNLDYIMFPERGSNK